MQDEKQNTGTEVAPSLQGQALPPSRTLRRWSRLPTIVKIILTLPAVMVLLGAEVELRLSPQLDVILTAAGICAMWTWLSGRPPAAM